MTKSTTAVILLLLSIGLFYAFTNGQYREVRELRAVAAEYQNVLQNASAIVALRDRLLVSYEALPKAEVDRIDKVLPDDIGTVRLALDLDDMASRYGISIKNIKATTEASEDAGLVVLPAYASIYGKATVSFSFISSYENFKRLLADLEKNLRIMDIKSVSFQAGEANLSDYQISVETYWLK